jgi:hypothetical protein
MSTYYWHIAHENFSTPAASSELDIKGCTIIRQKTEDPQQCKKEHIYRIATEGNICTVMKPDINPAYQITF